MSDDTIYLVKVSTKLSDRIENYDEDDEILNVEVEPIKELELEVDDTEDESEDENLDNLDNEGEDEEGGNHDEDLEEDDED